MRAKSLKHRTWSLISTLISVAHNLTSELFTHNFSLIKVSPVCDNIDFSSIPTILANREAELKLMKEALAKPGHSGARIVVLVGMGGAGKSTLAKVYAQKETNIQK